MSAASSCSKYGRRRRPEPLIRAWLALLVLSVASALLTLVPLPPAILAGGILILALTKSCVILSGYLDLSGTHWLRGFMMVLGLFVAIVFGLHLI